MLEPCALTEYWHKSPDILPFTQLRSVGGLHSNAKTQRSTSCTGNCVSLTVILWYNDPGVELSPSGAGRLHHNVKLKPHRNELPIVSKALFTVLHVFRSA